MQEAAGPAQMKEEIVEDETGVQVGTPEKLKIIAASEGVTEDDRVVRGAVQLGAGDCAGSGDPARTRPPPRQLRDRRG